ncbi:MAG TPA: hypothetical protein VFA40_00165 [Terriglobales bacterium]|nr:hypothetical protein [Terriglobales bacterium]
MNTDSISNIDSSFSVTMLATSSAAPSSFDDSQESDKGGKN